MKTRNSYQQAEEQVQELLATLTNRGFLEFPGLRQIGISSTDVRGDALAMACQCAKERFNGRIAERWEGRLEAMAVYGIVDLEALTKFVSFWSSPL